MLTKHEIGADFSFKINNLISASDKKIIYSHLRKNKALANKNNSELDKILSHSFYGCLYNKKEKLLAFVRIITDYGEIACIVNSFNIIPTVTLQEKDRYQQLLIEKLYSCSELKMIKKHKWFSIAPESPAVFKAAGFIDTANPGVLIFTREKQYERQKFNFSMPENLTVTSENNTFKNKAAALALLKTTPWGCDYTPDHWDRVTKYSRCYGLYYKKQFIGFLRIVFDTEGYTVAYLCDAIIHLAFRNKGCIKAFIKYISEDPQLQQINTWILLTQNPQTYHIAKKFGFESKQCNDLLRLPHSSDKIFQYSPKSASKIIADGIFGGIFVNNKLRSECTLNNGFYIFAAAAMLYVCKDCRNLVGIMVVCAFLAALKIGEKLFLQPEKTEERPSLKFS